MDLDDLFGNLSDLDEEFGDGLPTRAAPSIEEMTYSEYIQSPAWRSQHSKWLRAADHRCALIPFVRCGIKIRGKYRPYAIHHKSKAAYNPKRRGKEQRGRDIEVLCPFSHWFIHRVLGGADRVSKQKTPFPNRVQKIANTWCWLHWQVKMFLIFFVLESCLVVAWKVWMR